MSQIKDLYDRRPQLCREIYWGHGKQDGNVGLLQRHSTSYLDLILEVIGINHGCKRAEENRSIFSPLPGVLSSETPLK